MPVLCLDVSDGGLGVSSSNDGSLLIWLTDNGEIRRVLQGHIGDVDFCRFFPSGLVVISAAADIRLKIWSAENGSCPVTHVPHTRSVTDVSIIDKGRNVVTVSRDGFCKLVDVGETKCLATVGEANTIINSCAIQSVSEACAKILEINSDSNIPRSEREIGTDNKIIACACEDGYLRVFSVKQRSKIVEIFCESPVNCCCFLSETQIACGTQSGFIILYDLIEKTKSSWKEYRTAILSIRAFGFNNGFIATTADGSCFTWNLSPDRSVVDLTGSDVDPIYKVAFNQTHIFTCCRDGIIRKYDIKHLYSDGF